jgi:hypothetical protein
MLIMYVPNANITFLYIIKEEGFLPNGKQQIRTRVDMKTSNSDMKTSNSDMKIWCKQCRRIFSTIEDYVNSKHDPRHEIIFDF